MSDFDPTTNRIQFGVLNKDEQTALKNWPWGWEYYSFRWGGWKKLDQAAWCEEFVYRGKPAPVVTSVWQNINPHGTVLPVHFLRKDADIYSNPHRIAVLRIDTCNGVSTAHLETAHLEDA